MKLEFYPIDVGNWSTFETLMESKGAPHGCWCTAWIAVDKEGKTPTKSERKATMKKRVEEEIPVGLLVYSKGEAIGWCAVAPRDTYRALGGDEMKSNVWSVVCFFVKRAFRGQGLTSLFLEEASKYAKNQGAKYLEGYPVVQSSPSYRFMGFTSTFEKAGFEFVKKAGTRRMVMLRVLKKNE